jgi:hypothetical protein
VVRTRRDKLDPSDFGATEIAVLLASSQGLIRGACRFSPFLRTFAQFLANRPFSELQILTSLPKGFRQKGHKLWTTFSKPILMQKDLRTAQQATSLVREESIKLALLDSCSAPVR